MWGGTSPAFLLPAAAPTEAATAAWPPSLLGSASAASEAHAAAGAGASGAPSASAPWGCIAASLVVGAVAARASQRRSGIRRRATPPSEAGHEAAASADAAEEGGVLVPNAVGRGGLLRSFGAAGAGSLVVPLAPPSAYAKSYEDATKTAASLGLAQLVPPDKPEFGWSVVCEQVGVVPDANAGINKVGGEPLVATWFIPPLWIITKPTIDFNGSSGTLSANDYGKGDSATLYIDSAKRDKLETWTKAKYAKEIRKALSQKGKGFVDKLDVRSIRDGAPGYKIFSYEYNLESQAGFNIDRIGLASITQVGDKGNLQMLWTGVVGSRFGKMQEDLTKMVESFRIGKIPKGVKLEGFREFQTLDEVTSEAGGVKGADEA